MSETNCKNPQWLLWVIITLLLPVLAFPWLLARPETHKVLLWLYPVYALTSGYLAYHCYKERREMTVILLVLLVFSHIAIWLI